MCHTASVWPIKGRVHLVGVIIALFPEVGIVGHLRVVIGLRLRIGISTAWVHGIDGHHAFSDVLVEELQALSSSQPVHVRVEA